MNMVVILTFSVENEDIARCLWRIGCGRLALLRGHCYRAGRRDGSARCPDQAGA